jgi:transposase-like protein
MWSFCHSNRQANRNGFNLRPSDQKRIQQYKCVDCKGSFSATHFSIDYRLRKRKVNQEVFKRLSSGVSQRRCAFLVGVKPIVIARRVDRFGRCAENNLSVDRKSRSKVETVLIDAIESFEHTKCKPLTIPIAVEDKSRRILSLGVGKIAAKGHLTAISRRKYGLCLCERSKTLAKVFQELKAYVTEDVLFKLDEAITIHGPSRLTFLRLDTSATREGAALPSVKESLSEAAEIPCFSSITPTLTPCAETI